MTQPYWHDPEWRALLLAVVDQPEDAVRRAMCCDWLEERGEERAEWWGLPFVIGQRYEYRCTSAEWYRQDDNGVYPCKELAWTLPIREVVFLGNLSDIEVDIWRKHTKYASEDPTRSELALRFARS